MFNKILRVLGLASPGEEKKRKEKGKRPAKSAGKKPGFQKGPSKRSEARKKKGPGETWSPKGDAAGKGGERKDRAPRADRAKPRQPEKPWDPAAFVVEPAEGKKRFHDYNLPAEIMHAVHDLGFQYCTPIQAESLSLAMAGRNVAGKAQTGTGKTAAFLVTILKRMIERPDTRPTEPCRPAALVLGPTRELVIQIASDAEALGKYCGLRCVAVYGGMDYDKQQRQVQAEPVDLMVATPGRLLDFRRSGVVDLRHVHTLVIDEADRMLDMGFIPDVRRIIRELPDKDHRQTMLYSATLTDEVMRLASQWMPDPVKVEIEPEHLTAETITQVVYPISSKEKFKVLYNFLKREDAERVLVFCNRKVSCDRLLTSLSNYGIPCEMLSGDVPQKKRLEVLDDFRKGTCKVVVATDVAGRGIHVDDVAYVVNYDFPYEADDYVHRIGRTGRAGHKGTAISFACEDESFIIPDIEKMLGYELHCQMPDEELFAELPKPLFHNKPAARRERDGRGRPYGSGRYPGGQGGRESSDRHRRGDRRPRREGGRGSRPQQAAEGAPGAAQPPAASAGPAGDA